MAVPKVEIDYHINVKSPFHIGTGIEKGLIDRTILKDERGLLYIPGSVIKGNVRNIAEEIARNYNLRVCSPHKHGSNDSLQCFGDKPCIVCRIFGNHRRESGLFFEDAVLEPESNKLFKDAKYLQTEERTRVKISRKLRIAQHGALFTSEYGIRSLVFKGKIEGYISDYTEIKVLGEGDESGLPISYEIVLLLIALRSLERIGGDRSAGIGWVDIDIDPDHEKFAEKFIKYNGTDLHINRCFDSDHLGALEFVAMEREEMGK